MRAGTDLVRQQIPTRVSVNTVFQSSLLSIDQGMTGSSRFAVSMNSGGHGNIRSQTASSLAEIAGAHQTVLVIKDAIQGLTEGCILRIGSSENVTVTSFLVETTVTNATKTTITIGTPLQASYSATTQVVFVAFPVTLIQSAIAATKILIDASAPLVAGDRVATVVQHGSVTSVIDVARVASSTMVFVMSATTTRWLVTTTSPVTAAAGSTVFVRADTAYLSDEIQLPSLSGPYLIDVAGGKTFGTGDDGLIVSVAFKGSSDVTYTGPRNTVAISPPIRSGDLACWKYERGSAMLLGLDDVFLTPDATGRLGLGLDLPVFAPVNIDWVVSSSSPLTLNFETDTETTSATVVSGTETAVTLALTGTYVIIRAISAPGQPIRIKSNPMTAGFNTAQYSYHVSVSGSDVWSGCGLLLKPLTLQASDLLAMDSEQESMSITAGGMIL